MNSMEQSLFSVHQLAVGYEGKALIRDIGFSMQRGEILTLIGPNGAGKSTILKTLTRQLAPLAGTVHMGREDIRRMNAQKLAKHLSVVLTERTRTELMTCYDVVASGRYPYTGRFGVLREADHAIVRDCLERVHALDLAERDFLRISDGQRQRILLARALCQQPEVIILDEPTSFLDIRHKIELLAILRQMAQSQGITVILSLHEIDLAAKVSDRVMCVAGDGGLQIGTPETILTEETIARLYDLRQGSYNVRFGSVEMPKPQGNAQTFVLCGGGFGASVFRRLQRQNIPFFAGILFDNDVDYPLAKALASEVFVQTAFMPEDERVTKQALHALKQCNLLIHSGTPIRQGNESCALLLETAKKQGIQIQRSEP